MPNTNFIENYQIAEARFSIDSELREQTMKTQGLTTRIECIARNLGNQTSTNRQETASIKKMVKQLKVLSKKVNAELVSPLNEARSQAINRLESASQITQPKEFSSTMRELADSRQQIQKLRAKYDSVYLKAAEQLDESLELISTAKQTEILEALEAITDFENSMEIIRFFSLESFKLKLFLADITSKLEGAITNNSTQDQVQEIRKCIRTMTDLTAELSEVISTFESKQVGKLDMRNVYQSAKKNHDNACRTLQTGKTDSARLLMALADRHRLGEEVTNDLQKLQSLNSRFNQQFEDTTVLLNQLEQEYAEAAAQTLELEEELLEIEKRESLATPTANSKHDERSVITKLASVASSPDLSEGAQSPKATKLAAQELGKELIQQGHAKISWISQDIKELDQSNQARKKEVAQSAQVRLEVLKGRLDSVRTNSTLAEIQTLQNQLDIEVQELASLLERTKLLPNSPAPRIQTPSVEAPKEPYPKTPIPTVTSVANPEVSPLSNPSEHVEEHRATSTQSSATAHTVELIDPQASSAENQIVVRPLANRVAPVAQLALIPDAAKLAWLLPTTVTLLNFIQSRLDSIASKQQALKLQLLQTNQPHHPAWQHLNPAIQELESMRSTLLFAEHQFSPYFGQVVQMPLVEMLRLIQTEQHSTSFNPTNAVAFLESASTWLNAFHFNFDRSENHTNLAAYWLNANSANIYFGTR